MTWLDGTSEGLGEEDRSGGDLRRIFRRMWFCWKTSNKFHRLIATICFFRQAETPNLTRVTEPDPVWQRLHFKASPFFLAVPWLPFAWPVFRFARYGSQRMQLQPRKLWKIRRTCCARCNPRPLRPAFPRRARRERSGTPYSRKSTGLPRKYHPGGK